MKDEVILNLKLSARVKNACLAAGLKTTKDLKTKGISELVKMRNFGIKSLIELKNFMENDYFK